MLLDTASLYFRAYFGVASDMRTLDGRPVNAVRGLLDFIARLIAAYSPTHLAACWDNDWRPQWRVDLLPSYKTHRVATAAGPTASVVGAGGSGAESGVAEEAPDELSVQVPMILEVLSALGIAVVGADGYEADDVIATLASTLRVPTDVVTGDRDLFQLVDDAAGVRIVYTARGMSNLQVVDEAWITAKYGIAAAQYADFAVMRGDTSDGIPGVAGVGEKTAASLLGTYQDLDEIVTAAADPASALTAAQRAKFAAAQAYLRVGPPVVRVVRDLSLGVGLAGLELPSTPRDRTGFGRLEQEMGLGGSARRIVEALATR